MLQEDTYFSLNPSTSVHVNHTHNKLSIRARNIFNLNCLYYDYNLGTNLIQICGRQVLKKMAYHLYSCVTFKTKHSIGNGCKIYCIFVRRGTLSTEM
jgi:hypothetical protein